MILYNVTINIENPFIAEWVQWMQKSHIPDMMDTGLFTEYKFTRILAEEDGKSTNFAIQYLCPTKAAFEEYQAKHAKRLQKEHADRYKDKYVAFRTLMNVIAQEKRYV